MKSTISSTLVRSIIFILIVIFTVGLFSVINSSKVIFEKLIEDDMKFISFQTKEHFNSKINNLIDELNIISKSRNIELYTQNYQKKLIAEEFINHKEHFKVIAFLDENQKLVIRVLNGKIIKQRADIKSKFRSDLIQKAIQTPNKVVYSSIVNSKSLKDASVFFAISMTNFFDEKKGFILGMTSVKSIFKQNILPTSKGYRYRILDTNNNIVFTSVKNDSLKMINNFEHNILLKDKIKNVEYYIYNKDYNFGKVFVSLPYTYFENMVYSGIKDNIVTFLILLFLSILAIYIVSKRITNPLSQLVKQLNNNNSELEIKSNYKDITILSNTFNNQRENLLKINKKIQSLLDLFDAKVIASRTDLKGRITYASKAYENISGYSQDELIGKYHNIARHSDMPKEVFKDMWDTLKKDNIWKGEIKNKRKNGETYWLKATIEPLYDDGIKIGYSAVRENITSKKALEKLNHTLEEKVSQRTQEIENQLYFDSLTKLGSYQLLLEDVNKSDFMFTTLMLVNIDNFQNINGLYGFEAGNKMLKDFASCLNEFNKDKTYKLYRIYADEFVLFKNCEFTCIDDYYDDLVKLKETIQNYKFYIDAIDANTYIDATIGISLGQENPITTVDMALRYAKQHKLNFQTYNTTLDIKDQLQDTIKWKNEIKKAILENRILPVFQPILNRNQKIIKYEVLTRMQENIDDTKNLISPNKFLEESINAKQYNNIAKIVFTKAFAIMSKSDKLFSINLSYDDIYNNTLISFIEDYISSDKDMASRLIIEILETTEIGNNEIMKEFIDKFKSYGVRIAIDDFGTGHSNLSHILSIKPDFLKIDGAFIKNINEDKQSYAMVKSIVAFCQELEIKTIAEYVHSKEVFDTLYELGIDEYQGFYFSEPKVEI